MIGESEIHPDAVGGFALSAQQERIWKLRAESPGEPYVTGGTVRIEGLLDEALLAAAVEQTVERLEILRTMFQDQPGAGPLQVLGEPRVDWQPPLDLAALSGAERAEALAGRLRHLEGLPFDLQNGPVLRVLVARQAVDEHLLWLGLPALCADAAGFDNLVGEIVRAYRAQGGDELPEEEPVQYADLAAWLNGLLDQEGTRAERDYWRERAVAAAVPARLSTGFAPRTLQVGLRPGTAGQLRSLARTEGAAVSEVLLACWYLLLVRSTGEPELSMGVAFDGRDYEDLVPAVGLLARYLPLSWRIESPLADLRAVLRQVRRHLSVASEMQQFFTWEDAGAPRQSWGFEAEKPPAGPWSAPGLSFSILSRQAHLEPFLLKLSCLEGEETLETRFVYDASALSEVEVRGWEARFLALLESVLADPGAPVRELSILDEAERHRLIYEHNDTGVMSPDGSLPELLALQAARAPQGIAVEDAGESLTWTQLARRASRLAAHLSSRGVGPEVRVGVFLESGFDLVVGLLGILEAGGVCLPLDPADPEDRLDLILRDSDPPVVLGRAGSGLPAWAEPRRLDPSCLVEAPAGDKRASGEARPDNLACVIYTSSSTGRPQGVMVPHAAVVNLLHWMERRFPRSAGDRIVLKAPLTSETLIPEIFLPLLVGATLVFGDGGGENLPSFYGPAESAAGAASWNGAPIDNVRLLLTDAGLQMVPSGVTGEVGIAGAGLARGYLGSPDLTAERFVPDPFAERPGERLYRTGDLACLGPDGVFELTGRLDDRVHLRGYRIALGEIETALRRHPMVREAVAAVRGELQDPRLVAYLVADPGQAGANRDLLRLPDGLEIHYLNRSEALLIHQEIFEGEVYLKHGVRLADGDCVFDVGANIGLFTLFVHQRCRYPRVYAFEPVPTVFDRLRSNAALYGLDAELFDSGLAETAREATFTFYPRWSAMSGLYPDLAEEEKVTRASLESQDPKLARYADELIEGRFEAETFVTRLRTISDILREERIPRIDLLKIDVEKSELDVLRGIRDEDWPKIGQIVVELHDTGGRLDVVQGLLRDRGYRVVAEEDRRFQGTGLYNLYAVRAAWAERSTGRAEAPPGLERWKATPAALRGFLAGKLPVPMVPDELVLLDSLPRTARGRVDRRALAGLETGGDERWRDLAGLYEDAAETIVAGPEERPWRNLLPPLARVPRDGELPLSFPQQRLWLLDQMDPGNLAYVIPGALRLSGRLEVAVLRDSFAAIVARHEVLRTTFHEGSEQPVQVIMPAAPVPLPLADLSGLAPEHRESESSRLVAEASRTGFDLKRGPLLRLLLIRLHGEEHVLSVSMHHIVSDGWSHGILVGELTRLYGALATGAAPHLPELPIQYADFAVWQRRSLRGEALDAMLAVWRTRLAGAPAALDLPADRPRSAARTLRGATEFVRLEPAETAALQGLARGEGATLFMVLLAAFQALLHRYTGQEDLTVGSPIAGRSRPEVEPLIGFFVNTLVLRADLSGAPDFRELLRRAREVTLEAYSHQDLPFEKLVGEIQPERGPSHSPLFNTWIALQNVPTSSIQLPGLSLTPVAVDSGTAKFDLHFALTAEADGGLTGAMEYSTDLFDRATIQRMLAHFNGLLRQAGADPGRPIAELPLADEGELHQLRSEWSDTALPADAAEWTLLARLDAVVSRHPEEAALVQGGERITFAELGRRSDLLASHLQAQGVGAESRVGVCLERSPELLVALLGTFKAGGAFVPLDPDYPAERLAYMIEDSGARPLLTVEKLGTRLPASADVLRLDADWDAIAASPALPARSAAADGDNLAYVLYTSGSTGRPKGVMISRRGLDNYLRWGLGAYDVAAGSGAPAHTPVGFDLTLTSLLLPLLAGKPVVLLAGSPGGGELAAALRGKPGYSLVKLTPAHLDVLRQQLAPGERAGAARLLILGGEALRGESLAEWRQDSPETRLINEYGPTETVVGCSIHEIPPGEELTGPVPIGRPIDNTELYVVEPGGGLAPAGLTGELAIGGDGLARGYLGRPDLTAAAFVPHPFSRRTGARLYRTGDLARRRPDGVLEFLGRFDSQVKVRGFRIELGEIEASLARHPAVLEAVALVRTDGGDASLAAVVVPRPGADPGTLPRELREFLRSHLPEHMIPSTLGVMDALPLTPNGKVDRKALAAAHPAPDAAAEPAPAAEPESETEKTLAGIWRDLLKRPEVGRDDNFFELGGHSMHVVRLVARVRKMLGVELIPRDLLDHPTLADFARRVEAARKPAAGAEAPAIRPVPRDQELPLSFAQQRLWLTDRLEASESYNHPNGVRMSGRLDVPALERAIREVVHRHEVLRTSFPEIGGRPVQKIEPPGPLRLPVLDLDPLPAGEREAEVRRLFGEEARQAFDLGRAPLFRVRLLRLGAEEHVLLFTLHHIVTDAWSGGVLMREVAALYGAFSQGLPSPLAELPVQYADYAGWQRQWLQGEALQAQLAYWKQQLAGELPVIDLAADRPRPASGAARGAWRSFPLPTDLAVRLRELSQREGVTLFMTLLAAFQTLLYRQTGVEDIVVGTATAGRNRLETEGLIGFFINMLPLRTDLSGKPRFRELLARVRTAALGAYAHQELPFDLLVQELRPGRELSQTPFFRIAFSLNNVPQETLELAGLRLSPLGSAPETARFDLTVWVREPADGLAIDWTWRTDLFDTPEIESLQGRFEALLQDVVERPDALLASLETVAASERTQKEIEEKRREADKIHRFKQRRAAPVAVPSPTQPGPEEAGK